MAIDGHTKLAGLLGYPVSHTKSPMIHNTLAKAYEDNLVYLPFEVAPGDLSKAVKGAFALGVLGLNVTVPHKQAVMEHLAGIDPMAKALGAVNTLVRDKEGFIGYNTDILGLEQALLQAGIGVKGENVLILGAGGAARAAAFLSLKLGAKEIVIANRSVEKAVLLAMDLEKGKDMGLLSLEAADPVISACTINELAKNEGAGEDFLAFQCTSVGLSPNDTDCVLTKESESLFSRIHTGVDLIYRPAETMFMKHLRDGKKKAINGLNMLLYQGVIAYELWRGSFAGSIQTDPEVLEKIRRLLLED